MATFISPEGNPEVWDQKPRNYYSEDEWLKVHPPVLPEEPVSLQPSFVLREAAYKIESDKLRDTALSYQLEAQAWLEKGEEDQSALALEKYRVAVDAWLQKKSEIRDLYPDEVVTE